MKRTIIAGAALALGISLAGCAADAPGAIVTVSATVTAPITVVSSIAAPTVTKTVVTTKATTKTVTATPSPSADDATLQVCREVANELAANDVGSTIEMMATDGGAPAIAISAALDDWSPVDGRAAASDVAAAVDALNQRIDGLVNGDKIFTQWESADVEPLYGEYLAVQSACLDNGYDWNG